MRASESWARHGSHTAGGGGGVLKRQCEVWSTRGPQWQARGRRCAGGRGQCRKRKRTKNERERQERPAGGLNEDGSGNMSEGRSRRRSGSGNGKEAAGKACVGMYYWEGTRQSEKGSERWIDITSKLHSPQFNAGGDA